MDGATLDQNECAFRVWAPSAREVALRIVGQPDRKMHRESDGRFYLTAQAKAGDRYFYVVDGQKAVPDPVSRLLPEGVHGPTQIVDPAAFQWTDSEWNGLPLNDYIIYELHTGTFSPQGTFAGVAERLEYLKRELGITVIELMPVAAFPGERNWGYDGVSPYAVQASYGGPDELKRLVDAAHRVGIAVILDVVYNHLGNEGNYLPVFGPYFTHRYRTPWGHAINYDGPGSDGVRQFFIANALYWIREYHLDGLRLDAVQTIRDQSPRHILAEIQHEVQRLAQDLKRRVCVIAETDENDARLLRAPAEGGYGLDAVWSDDFHHAIYAAMTGESSGYYQDFGQFSQIVRALNEGFVYQGEHFKFWNRARGTSSRGIPLPAHVVCLQNHDQVGNRAKGERLTELIPRGGGKLAAALLILAAETPLIFMGQEYDEAAPFQFFTNYQDADLARKVSEGRRSEFMDFAWDDVPDPQSVETFRRSRLNWHLATGGNEMLRWYRSLIEIRKAYIAPSDRTCRARLWDETTVILELPAASPRLLVVANFKPVTNQYAIPAGWKLALANNEDGYQVSVWHKS
jgi:maltooligosyltrehalose trehalohydrolase